MKINKAVIAAAGRGTRFLPITKAYPKELLPVGDKPIIQHLVEEILNAGIEEICIVYRYGNLTIRRYFEADPDLNYYLQANGKRDRLKNFKHLEKKAQNWHFLPQPPQAPYGTGTPVLIAKDFIGDDPFVYFYGDDLILEKESGHFLRHLIKVFEQHQAAAVFGAQAVPWAEIERYGSVRYCQQSKIPNQIETVEEGFGKDKAPSNFVQFGRFVVSPKVFAFLETQPLSKTNELFFTDTMKAMAQENIVIAEPLKEGQWLTTGDPQRWLETNQEFAKK